MTDPPTTHSELAEPAGEAGPADAAPEKPAPRLRGRDVVCGLVVCAVMLALWLPRLSGPIDLRTDAAVYYITGVALAEGHGYVMTSEPGEMAAVQYPPLLPAVVALHRWVAGTADPQVLGSLLRKTYILISLAYALSVYVMARQFLTTGYACLVGVITVLFLQSYFLSNALFAEIPFALVTMLLLIANQRPQRPSLFILSAILAGAAYLLRSAGIAVLAAWVGEAVLRRQWKQVALRAAVALIPVVAWQGYVRSVTTSEAYAKPAYEYQRAAYQYYNVPYTQNVTLTDPFRPEEGEVTNAILARRLIENLLLMPRSVGYSVSTVPGYYDWTVRDLHNHVLRRIGLPRPPYWASMLWPTLLGLVALGGGVILAVRRQWLICLYAAATIGLVCLTPWPQQFTRYLTPLTPVLALGLVTGLSLVRERLRSRYSLLGQTLVIALLGSVLLMQAYTLIRAYRSGWVQVPAADTRIGGGRMYFFDEAWQAYAKAMEWLRQEVQPGEVVALGTPQWGTIAGGFKAVMPPMEIDPAEAQRLMDTVPVRYAIVDEVDVGEITGRYLAPAIEAHPDLWVLVYTVPGSNTRIFRRTLVTAGPETGALGEE